MRVNFGDRVLLLYHSSSLFFFSFLSSFTMSSKGTLRPQHNVLMLSVAAILQQSANTMLSSFSHTGSNAHRQLHRTPKSKPILSILAWRLLRLHGILKRTLSLPIPSFRDGSSTLDLLLNRISSLSDVEKLVYLLLTKLGTRQSHGLRSVLENLRR